MMTVKQYAASVEREDFVLANRHDLGVDKVYGSQSFWRDALGRFVKNKGAVFGLVIVTVFLPDVYLEFSAYMSSYPLV